MTLRLKNDPLIAGIVKLSRWKEHPLFTIPATLAGANLAIRDFPSHHFDERLIAVLLANILAVSFAFMVNDIEDAPDDARDIMRGASNAVSCGEITPRQGWRVAWITALLALCAFASVNVNTLGIGVLTLGLGWFYSWRVVRLKALPVVDVISHLLMLSSLLFLAGYYAYNAAPGAAWWAAAGVGLISAYGQLYNQLRDYDLDRAAGLRNTSCFLGRQNTQRVMYVCLVGAAVCLAITVGIGLWPLWLAGIPLVALPLLLVRRSSVDMRGSRAVDTSGQFQAGAMWIATVMMIIWSAQNIIW